MKIALPIVDRNPNNARGCSLIYFMISSNALAPALL